MNANIPDPPDPEEDSPAERNQVEEFFQRLPGSFRWPKPNAEAVAAAVEAIHRMSGGAAAAQGMAKDGQPLDSDGDGEHTCSACGGLLQSSARFCVWCGIPTEPVANPATTQSQTSPGQHHIHHHYHHLVPAAGTMAAAPSNPSSGSEATAPRGRAPGSAGAGGGRAEAGARQVVQDWAQACNTKHIDDLLELYSADATVIRSSVPPVRSLPAIREFLVSLLDAGLGDVEMESLRVDVMGEIAMDVGRCKMLVPVAMGKRREERGKYLVVLVRQPAGGWKIMADCWSSDLAISASPALEPATLKASEPIVPVRKPR